ncbi:MAG: malectin domain-containing carbohydrate-binding protein [Pseudomonadota bacterium]
MTGISLFSCGIAVADEPLPILAINAGSSKPLTVSGIDFVADTYAQGGENFNLSRWGDQTTKSYLGTLRGGPSISYELPVDPGLYDIELSFTENWHRSAGKRVFDVSAEGQIVAKGVDVFAQAGERAKVHVITLSNIDSGKDGDPQTLSLKFTKVIDNAIINGIKVTCPASNAQCREVQLARVAERAAAEKRRQEAEELANRKPTTARYGLWYNLRTRGSVVAQFLKLAVDLTGNEDGVVVQIRDRRDGYYDRKLGRDGLGQSINCVIYFTPAERFADMVYQGDTCGEGSGPFKMATHSNGLPQVTGRFYGANVTFNMTGPNAVPGARYSAPPKELPSFKGVSYSPDLADMKKQVEMALFGKKAVQGWEMKNSDNGRVIYSLSSPQKSSQTPPEDTFEIHTDGPGPDARVWGFRRLWYPAEDKRPTVDTLSNALKKKYGEPSGVYKKSQRFGATPRRGVAWSYDDSGTLGDQRLVHVCGFSSAWPPAEQPVRGSFEFPRWEKTPEIFVVARSGCGHQMVVSDIFLIETNQVRNVAFSYFDPQVAEVSAWKGALADHKALLDRQDLRKAAAAKKSKAEKREDVDADL